MFHTCTIFFTSVALTNVRCSLCKKELGNKLTNYYIDSLLKINCTEVGIRRQRCRKGGIYKKKKTPRFTLFKDQANDTTVCQISLTVSLKGGGDILYKVHKLSFTNIRMLRYCNANCLQNSFSFETIGSVGVASNITVGTVLRCG